MILVFTKTGPDEFKDFLKKRDVLDQHSAAKDADYFGFD
jgi:hypothetical protein